MVDDEPPWTEVLDWLYENGPYPEMEAHPDDKFYLRNLNETVKEELELGPEDAHDAVASLNRHGLVEPIGVENTEEDGPDSKYIAGLSEKGFNVAHERRLEEKQSRINKSSARLSAFLVVGVSVQALAAGTQVKGVEGGLLVLIAGAIVLVAFLELHGSGLRD